MPLFKIKLRVKSVKNSLNYREIFENIILDENTGKHFLRELKEFIEKLEALKMNNSQKITKLKYFIKSFQFKDIRKKTKEITINTQKNLENRTGTIRITTNHTLTSSPISELLNKNILDNSSELSVFNSKSVSINEHLA
jgi:hypothetical protein